MHYNLAALLEERPDLLEAFAKMPIKTAKPDLARALAHATSPGDVAELEATIQASPVHKLNWRHSYSEAALSAL